MTHGGGSLAPMDTEVIPAEILELVDAREQEILTGLFRVNVNDSEPTSTN